MHKIPVFEAKIISWDEGIANISLVDLPAVESNFLAFDKNKAPLKFAVENEEQRMILGVLMRADYPIYRYSDDMGEYFIKYSKETIQKMSEKLFKDGNQNNVNIMHLANSNVEGVNLIQAFLKDSSKGISPAGFEDIEEGSLFAQFKVENDDIWAAIKDGTFKGFSIEGLFDVVPTAEKFKKNKRNNTMAKLKEKLKALLMEFASVETDKGELYYNEALEVGAEVFDADDQPAADGEYTTEDKVIVVADGKITEIREKEEEGIDEIEVDARRQRFNKIRAAYEETYDEKMQKIYKAISDKGFECWIVEAADSYAVVEIWNEAEMTYKNYRFEISWDEEGNAIAGDPVEVVSEFVPAEDAAEDEAIAQEEEKTAEEAFAEEEAPAEEAAEEEEVDEKEARIAALEEEVKSIKDEIASIKESLAAIANEPAAEPVTEEFAKVSAPVSNTNRQVNNLLRIINAK